MQTYHEFLKHILCNGVGKGDRTGTGTMSTFGYQMRFGLSNGVLPVVTTKKVHLKSVIHELLWFLRGETNTKYLEDNGVTIWREWQDENGDLGRVYGAQWRDWIGPNGEHIDQIQNVLDRLKTHPDCRRLIVTAWQPAEVDKMALPPCHAFFQFYTRMLTDPERLYAAKNRLVESGVLEKAEDASPNDCRIYDADGEFREWVPERSLSCQLYQRSADAFLGVPFNITSYALLTHIFAKIVNMEPGEFIWVGGDCHIYTNHLQQVGVQLSRTPLAMPTVSILPTEADGSTRLEHLTFDHISVNDYISHPGIPAKVAV